MHSPQQFFEQTPAQGSLIQEDPYGIPRCRPQVYPHNYLQHYVSLNEDELFKVDNRVRPEIETT